MTCLPWGSRARSVAIAGFHVRLQRIFVPLQLTVMAAGTLFELGIKSDFRETGVLRPCDVTNPSCNFYIRSTSSPAVSFVCVRGRDNGDNMSCLSQASVRVAILGLANSATFNTLDGQNVGPGDQWSKFRIITVKGSQGIEALEE